MTNGINEKCDSGSHEICSGKALYYDAVTVIASVSDCQCVCHNAKEEF